MEVKYSVNKRGGIYKRGAAYGLDKKIYVAQLYFRFGPGTSIRFLAKNARVSQDFARRVLEDLNALPRLIPRHRKRVGKGRGAASTMATIAGRAAIPAAASISTIDAVAVAIERGNTPIDAASGSMAPTTATASRLLVNNIILDRKKTREVRRSGRLANKHEYRDLKV